MFIAEDVKYIGVNDPDVRLFEGQYPTPNGMAYNSYLILDERIAILDSVEAGCRDRWLAAIRSRLGDRRPDYLIIQHMEPDHSANIAEFVKEYPEVRLVSTAAAFKMMEAFFGTDFKENRIVVTDGSTLTLGRHSLAFLTAPMVHWPEVMMTYDDYDKILFSADAFGKFGTVDACEDWREEARRYYIGIVGKYGKQVQALLKKLAALDVEIICPLHGPILPENLEYYLWFYDTWSSYRPEICGVTIAVSSIYGNTLSAAKQLLSELREKGVSAELYDLNRTHSSEAVAAAFKSSHLVLASATYNTDVFPSMRALLHGLAERGYRDRRVYLIENGSWAPSAAKVMREELAGCADVVISDRVVRVNSAVNDGTRGEISRLAEEIASSVLSCDAD